MEINKEQKEAIEFIKDLIAWDVRQDLCPNKEECENLETILNLIEKLQKENEEKNKIINSMIKVMIENSICDYFIKEKCKNYAGENGKTCDECIKQYFENKVKEVK